MRIIFYVPPVFPEPRERSVWFTPDAPVWPEGWPLPRVGETVYVPVKVDPERSDYPLYVGHIAWYPGGDSGDSEDKEPYVHIALRQNRPE